MTIISQAGTRTPRLAQGFRAANRPIKKNSKIIPIPMPYLFGHLGITSALGQAFDLDSLNGKKTYAMQQTTCDDQFYRSAWRCWVLRTFPGMGTSSSECRDC